MDRQGSWWLTAKIVALFAVGFAIHGFGYWQGRENGFHRGVKAMVPETARVCTVMHIAVLRNASRMLEAKNRQTELSLRSARP